MQKSLNFTKSVRSVGFNYVDEHLICSLITFQKFSKSCHSHMIRKFYYFHPYLEFKQSVQTTVVYDVTVSQSSYISNKSPATDSELSWRCIVKAPKFCHSTPYPQVSYLCFECFAMNMSNHYINSHHQSTWLHPHLIYCYFIARPPTSSSLANKSLTAPFDIYNFARGIIFLPRSCYPSTSSYSLIHLTLRVPSLFNSYSCRSLTALSLIITLSVIFFNLKTRCFIWLLESDFVERDSDWT